MVGLAVGLGVLLGALSRDTKLAPAVMGMALVVLLGTFGVASLWRPGRPINGEAETVLNLRALLSAQRTYASINSDLFEGRIECLAKPQLCRPYPSSAPPFIHPEEVPAEGGAKGGFLFLYFPETWQASILEERPDISRSSVKAFAVVAVPLPWLRGTTEGRSFCVDSRGVLCSTETGVVPEVRNGECHACTPMDPWP
jgi:hypothetical protein